MIKLFYNEQDLEVDITGAIGSDWFDEGNTRESVLNQIKDSEAENITVNIHSLGGDLLEAFAIYDALKIFPARVTTKMVGATASAGTIIAMAGDQVEITENTKFLIHNASTVTMGNAEEHQRSTEALRRFDDDIVNIYRKKTGKRKAEIKDLMSKEIWIDANEAKAWGFVDKVTKTTNKVENYKKYSEILNIKNMNTEILELLTITEDGEALAAIQNLINENEALKTENANFENLQEQFDELKAEMEADQQAKINTIVDEAVKVGKIKSDNKQLYVDLLTNDFDSGKKILDSIEAAKPTMKAVAKGIKDEPEPEKTYKWYVENDREGLYNLAKTNPEKYQEILKTK